MAGETLNLKLVIGGSNDGAIRALNQVVDAASRAGSNLTRADVGTFSKTRAGTESISKQLAQIQDFAIGLAGGGALLRIGQQLLSMADSAKAVESRVGLASFSLGEFITNLKTIRAIAREAGVEVAAVAALFNRIVVPVREMGGTSAQALEVVRSVGQALRISGASAAESSAAMTQFAQALGSGILRGEELNSILENAPRLAQAVAAGLGVSTSELRKLGEQGALTSQQVLKAIQSQQAVLAGEASRLPATLAQGWTNVTQALTQYVGQVDKATGSTTAIAAALNTVADNIPAIASGLGDLALLAAAAFGTRQIVALASYIALQQKNIATNRLAAAEDVRRVQLENSVAQAMAIKAAAELRNIEITASYTLVTNEATVAETRRAAAARMAAANQGAVTASMALAEVQATASAASIGLMGRAMVGAASVGRGLLALFGGWPGLVITGITAAALAWEHFRAKGKQASEETGQNLAAMTRQFQEFSGKMGSLEAADALQKLQDKAAQAREQLQSPLFRASDEGRKLAADLKVADEAIDAFGQQVSRFVNNRTKERGLLGLDKLKLDAGGLIDQDTLKELQAFEMLYREFAAGAVGDNNRLKASALDLRAALDELFSKAKTPAELTGLVERLGTALKGSPNDAGLRSSLETAIEARSRAELQALNNLVAGLEARAQRTQALFSSAANVALTQFNEAAALAKVAAELRNDLAGGARSEAASRNAEVMAAKTSADLQIGLLEETAARKRQVAAQTATALKAQARDEIEAVRATERQKLMEIEAAVAKGSITERQAADERATLARKSAEDIRQALAARGQAEATAARQIRDVDAQTAQQRLAIAQQLYDTLKSKAADALSSYRNYAQQVISLDQQIVSNRLNTAAAVGALRRQDLSPAEQAKSLRDELEALKRETNNAQVEGKSDFAKELLQRQLNLAQTIGGLSGDGIDPKAQREQAIAEINRIGQETDSVLRAQRDAAASAAATQLEQYRQMTEAMNGLAKQITTLNEQAAIKLRPEIDQAALEGALQAVRNAFAGLVLPVKVQAIGLPDNAVVPPADLPARAYGGPLPGYSPHDRADNMLYLGTPGEWVIDRPAVRYYGENFMRNLLARRIPRYAYGGAIGRLSVPSLQPGNPGGGSGSVLQPVNLHIGGSRYAMSASPDVVASLKNALVREALRKGDR